MWRGEGASVTLGALGQAIAIARGVGLAWAGPSLSRWAVAERGRFAPWLAVAMAAGVVWFFGLSFEPAAWIGFAALAGTAAVARLAWHHALARAVVAMAAAVALGFASAQFATWHAFPPAAVPSGAGFVTGVVRSVERLPEGRRVTLAEPRLGADSPALDRSIRIRLRDTDAVAIAAGDTLRVRALLRPPPPPAYPGGWDLQRDAFFAGSAGSGFAIGAAERVAQATPSGLARSVQALRDMISKRIMTALPGADGAIAATLLTGTGAAIPPADRTAFRDSGLAHLLAVAGLHIGIVMGLAMGTTRFGLALSERASLHWPCKQLAATAALAAGAGYLVLTGMHVPILRSFAMAALVTLGIILGRRALSLRGLALAAVGLMLATPWEVVSVSFQMSFSAVLALIAGYEVMQPLLARLHGAGGALRGSAHHVVALALTSLLAGTASAPFAAYHFGHFQLYFILANLIAVPLTAMWVMPAGLAALGLMPFGLERVALTPMGWGIDVILWIVRHVAALPAAAIGVPHFPAWGLACTALGIAWLELWRTPVRLAGLAPIVAGLMAGLISHPADLLVSPDARLIALRGPDGVLMQTRPGLSPFSRDAELQYWGVAVSAPFPESGMPGLARCNLDGCVLQGKAAAISLARSGKKADCTGISLVVSAEPVHGVCPPGTSVIDRFTVWRDGAQAVWFTQDGLTILSDRTARGDRLWVPPLPSPRRTSPALPMAESETLDGQ